MKTNFGSKDIFLLRVGLFLTIVADFFMVYLDKNAIGIFFFCMVQITYAIRYDRKGALITAKALTCMIGTVLIVATIFRPDGLYILGAVYSVCLGTSVYKALALWRKGYYPARNKWLINVGMILFLLCDINVALSYTLGNRIFFALIWIFYLPSQILLVTSGSRQDCPK